MLSYLSHRCGVYTDTPLEESHRHSSRVYSKNRTGVCVFRPVCLFSFFAWMIHTTEHNNRPNSSARRLQDAGSLLSRKSRWSCRIENQRESALSSGRSQYPNGVQQDHEQGAARCIVFPSSFSRSDKCHFTPPVPVLDAQETQEWDPGCITLRSNALDLTRRLAKNMSLTSPRLLYFCPRALEPPASPPLRQLFDIYAQRNNQ